MSSFVLCVSVFKLINVSFLCYGSMETRVGNNESIYLIFNGLLYLYDWDECLSLNQNAMWRACNCYCNLV